MLNIFSILPLNQSINLSITNEDHQSQMNVENSSTSIKKIRIATFVYEN
jgi:hypothetical protein